MANTLGKLILHIGHPKTGTTALQTVFAASSSNLLDAGILYPVRTSPEWPKHSLAKPYLTGTDNSSLQRRTGLSGDALYQESLNYWNRLRLEVASSAHKLLLLSAEGLFCRPSDPYFRTKIADICDKVTVVAYLRSPASRFLSQINQKLRMLNSFSLPPAEYYRPVIEGYREAGFETISLNVYDRKRLRSGDIVDDFCYKHLQTTNLQLTRGRHEKSNVSISSEALVVLSEILSPLNYSSLFSRDSRFKLIKFLRRADEMLGSPLRPSLKQDVEAALVARSTDLLWLREEYGVLFDDVDYDIIGATGMPDLSIMSKLEEFCHIDQDRIAALREIAKSAVIDI